MSELENLSEAIAGMNKLKPYKGAFVLKKVGKKRYFRGVPLFAFNPNWTNEIKEAKQWKTRQEAIVYRNTYLDDSYMLVSITIQ